MKVPKVPKASVVRVRGKKGRFLGVFEVFLRGAKVLGIGRHPKRRDFQGVKMMISVGLDLATKTGWCVAQDGKILASGVQDFSKRRGESNGILFFRFRKWMAELMRTCPAEPSVVVYERAHYRGGAATEICVGLQTHAQGMAAELGIESAGVTTGELKAFACGYGGRKTKEDVMRKAEGVLGRKPLDDNEADAVFAALWGEREFLAF